MGFEGLLATLVFRFYIVLIPLFGSCYNRVIAFHYFWFDWDAVLGDPLLSPFHCVYFRYALPTISRPTWLRNFLLVWLLSWFGSPIWTFWCGGLKGSICPYWTTSGMHMWHPILGCHAIHTQSCMQQNRTRSAHQVCNHWVKTMLVLRCEINGLLHW